MLQEVKRQKQLTNSQKRGIIRIIYKKDGRVFIKNYRPISLLNIDLKILTRTLAKRLANVLEDVIHKSQTSLNGRHITKNIHILQDLIDVINNENGEAAIIFLDQEKAFDRMSHTFLFKTLKKFGIGENFIDWIKIIYTDIKGSVKINGFLTEEFDIKRGVRQGCPLSALLYVLCAEVLGITIRNEPSIKGFHFNNEEHKSSQYADDMYASVTDLISVDNLFFVLKKYEKATQSRVNSDKTEGLWVGNWKNKKEKPQGLKWNNKGVKTLGVHVGNERKEMARLDFEEQKEKIKNSLIYWKAKGLSLKARIKILNIFILSKLWYLCECADIPTDIQTDIQKMIVDFIWNGKKHHQRSYKHLIK